MKNESPLPDWVKRNLKKGLERLQFEGKTVYRYFPHIQTLLEGETFILEGPVVTLSGNQYTVRVVYGPDYPNHPPAGYVRDADVVDFCARSGGHAYHNYGKDKHGLRLCLLNPSDMVYKGWTPNQSGVTILEYAIAWLHAYEFKRARGVWLLPETK